MAYEKVTLSVFKKKLSAGDYAGATGARRALGRVTMTKNEKLAAAKMIDRKFGKGK